MTKEELKQKAKFNWETSVSISGGLSDEQIYTEGFIEGYEQGQKETISYKDSYIRDLNEIFDILKKENAELKAKWENAVVVDEHNSDEFARLHKVEESYNNLCKDLAEIKSAFMTCPLDNKEELGRLIDKLNYEI